MLTNLGGGARVEGAGALASLLQRTLSKPQKRIPSKYFYDAAGSELFEQIMRLPEYYPARCEQEILSTQAARIAFLMPKEHFTLVDLGSGDGTKTEYLLQALLQAGRAFTYHPVDISAYALQEQQRRLAVSLPKVDFHGLVGDFSKAFAWLSSQRGTEPMFLLFLGGNVGNFEHKQALDFFKEIYWLCRPKDRLVVGFDLQKDPELIRAAYNDASGVTARFNYNLLVRANRELGAQFDLADWSHYPIYDPLYGAARSFLVCNRAHQVWVQAFERHLDFRLWETIHTENSYKYTHPGIEEMATASGFSILEHVMDDKQWFTDSVWERIE